MLFPYRCAVCVSSTNGAVFCHYHTQTGWNTNSKLSTVSDKSVCLLSAFAEHIAGPCLVGGRLDLLFSLSAFVNKHLQCLPCLSASGLLNGAASKVTEECVLKDKYAIRQCTYPICPFRLT